MPQSLRIALLITCIFSVMSCAYLSDPEPIVTNGNYNEIAHVSEIPNPILEIFNNANFCQGLADRDSRFNATDVIDQNIPCRRLISSGNLGNVWFVYYESGGFAYTKILMAVELSSGRVSSWALNSPKSPIEFEEIRAMLSNSKMCEAKEYESREKASFEPFQLNLCRVEK